MSTAAERSIKIFHAPARKTPRGKENPIVIHIEVDPDDHTAAVSVTPALVMLIYGDFIKFTSNSAKSAIRFVKTSPFESPADEGEPFPFGKASPPLQVVHPLGSCHFDCGYIEDGRFESWPGGGGEIPGGSGGHGG